jgi:perosamine synthetase
LILPSVSDGCDVSWFVFVVRLNNDFTAQQRDLVLREMTARGIQTNNYFPPVHLQPFIAQKYGYKKGVFPIAEAVSERTIALPFHNQLSKDTVAEVCRELKSILDSI